MQPTTWGAVRSQPTRFGGALRCKRGGTVHWPPSDCLAENQHGQTPARNMIQPDPKAHQTPTPSQPRTRLLTDDSGTPTCLCPHPGGPPRTCSVCLRVIPRWEHFPGPRPGRPLARAGPQLPREPGQPVPSVRLCHVEFICVTASTHLREGDASLSRTLQVVLD